MSINIVSARSIVAQISQEKNPKTSLRKQYICVLIFYLAFILISACIFKYLEDISYIDGLYFTVVTQSTVGYGDITPQTSKGLVFNFFFIIISFGIIIILFNLVFDSWFDSKINELCAEIQDDIKEIKLIGSELHTAQVVMKTEKEKKHHQKKLYILTYLSIYILWVVIWVLFFWLNPNEGKFRFFEALYFSLITSTTVGYGSLSPQTDAGKLFVFFFVTIGVMTLAIVLSALSEQIMDIVKKFEPKSIAENTANRKASQKEKLTALLSDYNVMTKHHYIVYRLLKTKQISNEQYQELEKEFHILDKDGNELLDENDLGLFTPDVSLVSEVNNEVDNAYAKDHIPLLQINDP